MSDDNNLIDSPTITDKPEDAGNAFQDAIDALVEDEAWEELGWLEAALGILAAARPDTGELESLLGNPIGNAANDSIWGDLPGVENTNIEKLKVIEEAVANDPDFDMDKWRGLLSSFRGLGIVAGPITAYEYYLVWKDIAWIAKNTQGWKASEFIDVFGELIADIPFAVITLFAEMTGQIDRAREEDWDEVVFPKGEDRWNPAPVPVHVAGGKVQVLHPKKGQLDWVYTPLEASPPQGDWVDDLRSGLRKELEDWLISEVELGEQPDVRPGFAPLPGVKIEVPTGPKAQEDWKKGRFRFRFNQWDPEPASNKDPAEKWRVRKDVKAKGWWLYKGFLKLLNKTYGELDEIRDVWEAIEENLVAEYADGRIVYFDDLNAYGKLLLFAELGHGVSLNVDGDGLIFDLFMNELIDRTVGELSKKQRQWLEENGVRGIFDSGNMTTWWNRWESRVEQIRRQTEAIKAAEEQAKQDQQENQDGV